MNYAISTSVEVSRGTDGQYLVYNGLNARLELPEGLGRLLRTFEVPRLLEDAIREAGGSREVAEFLQELVRVLVLVPEAPDDENDMRVTWNCLAMGTDADAAYVIDNETRSMEEFERAGKDGVEALENIITLDPSWAVVNIGCGMGRLDRPLSGRVRKVWGFDVSDLMIERGRQYLADCPNVELRRTDSELTGVSDKEVDLVICFLVFQHCPKDVTWKYFREAYRVLKDTGCFVFQILCNDSMEGWDPSARSPIQRYYGTGKPRYRDQEVRSRLADTGFTIETFRDGSYDGQERRLSGIPATHWTSKIVRARKIISHSN